MAGLFGLSLYLAAASVVTPLQRSGLVAARWVKPIMLPILLTSFVLSWLSSTLELPHDQWWPPVLFIGGFAMFIFIGFRSMLTSFGKFLLQRFGRPTGSMPIDDAEPNDLKLSLGLRERFPRWIPFLGPSKREPVVPEEVLVEARALASEQNLRTAPPEDERITLPCLWAVEFYSPSHIDGLVDGLRKIGWSGERDLFESENPVSWLSRTRRHGDGGWKTLGFLVSPGVDKNLPEVVRYGPLPDGVEYCHASVAVLTPSLIAVAVCFTFGQEKSTVFEEILRRDRQPISKKTQRGWEHYLPPSQKINDIRQARIELVELAASWFSENLPGIFSSGLLDSEVPTCELLTFQKAEPIPRKTDDDLVAREYLMTLGVYWGTDSWFVSSRPGLKFNLPHSVFFGPPNHCVLTARESEVGDAPHYVDSQMMPGVLCEAAIFPLLTGYEYRMRKVRDLVGSESSRLKNPAKVLETIVASDSIDMTAMISELASAPSEGLRLFRSTSKLEPSHPALVHAESLNQLLHALIRSVGLRAQQADRATNERLTQLGSLLGAVENVRLQKRIAKLTWVLLAVGVASLVALLLSSDASIQEVIQKVQDLWSRLV